MQKRKTIVSCGGGVGHERREWLFKERMDVSYFDCKTWDDSYERTKDSDETPDPEQ